MKQKKQNFFSSLFFLFLLFLSGFAGGRIIAQPLGGLEPSALQSPLPLQGVPTIQGTPLLQESQMIQGLPFVQEKFVRETSAQEKSTQEKSAQQTSEPLDFAKTLLEKSDALTSHDGLIRTLQTVLMLSVLSLVPAILMMTTSFVRIMTVLSILRQAIGTGQIPPNQVLTALSVFLTLLIMTPVWTEVYDRAIVPYSQQKITVDEVIQTGSAPIRTFMIRQMEQCGNTEDIWLFMKYIPGAKTPEFYDEVPWAALLPAFMVSELKVAFLIGFQLFLPFVIIDLVVSGVMVSMGMMMLPPVIVSLPFKLMLFVLMDGWTLVIKMLLDSFVWYAGG